MSIETSRGYNDTSSNSFELLSNPSFPDADTRPLDEGLIASLMDGVDKSYEELTRIPESKEVRAYKILEAMESSEKLQTFRNEELNSQQL